MADPLKLSETREWESWRLLAEKTVADIIAQDPHGPYPAQGQVIRCFLSDGQVFDGRVACVWLDLDVVRIHVQAMLAALGSALVRVTPSQGDRWEPL